MDFKSVIYSIGVLLWLLSSGRKPFCDEACWENDPDERPSIKQVVSYLKSINQDINEETNSNKFVKNEIKR
ncbi:uncharacterized protein OCT59_021185 [Rhizophagus irregularis]|uniref:uncharacterized protein n=1 Tax=Rhizophagus irregularis TaxID=588596 RepID=UPI00332F5B15|nr:hypothetical protein OCT59_021185 [Rhizophagus irregularis]